MNAEELAGQAGTTAERIERLAELGVLEPLALYRARNRDSSEEGEAVPSPA